MFKSSDRTIVRIASLGVTVRKASLIKGHNLKNLILDCKGNKSIGKKKNETRWYMLFR